MASSGPTRVSCAAPPATLSMPPKWPTTVAVPVARFTVTASVRPPKSRASSPPLALRVPAREAVSLENTKASAKSPVVTFSMPEKAKASAPLTVPLPGPVNRQVVPPAADSTMVSSPAPLWSDTAVSQDGTLSRMNLSLPPPALIVSSRTSVRSRVVPLMVSVAPSMTIVSSPPPVSRDRIGDGAVRPVRSMVAS